MDAVLQKRHVLMVRETVTHIQNALMGLSATQITVPGIVQLTCVSLMCLVHVHPNLVIHFFYKNNFIRTSRLKIAKN